MKAYAVKGTTRKMQAVASTRFVGLLKKNVDKLPVSADNCLTERVLYKGSTLNYYTSGLLAARK